MQILHVAPTYFPAVRYGGPIFSVHGLCRALAARGHRIEVFTTNVDGPNNSDVPLGVPVLLDGVRIRYFRSDILRRLYRSPTLGRALKAELRTFSLVHIHSVFVWPTWAAARSASTGGIPYVLSPRGMLVKDLIQRRNPIVKSAWIQLFEKSNLEHASAIHTTSELEAEELKWFKFRLARVATIANGIDNITTFSPDDVSSDVKDIVRDRPIILSFGRISWKKGFDRLLHAFALTTAGTLAIVGPDDENMVPQLKRLAQSLQIEGRVRILPRFISGADKEYLLKSSQIYVLPSYSENFGNTVLKSMQRGVPVVVTPEVGAAEIVRVSGGGIVTGGERRSLSEALNRLLKDTQLARSMGEAGSRHALRHYGWSGIAEQMESLYQSLGA